jgi:hypothetical protein
MERLLSIISIITDKKTSRKNPVEKKILHGQLPSTSRRLVACPQPAYPGRTLNPPLLSPVCDKNPFRRAEAVGLLPS